MVEEWFKLASRHTLGPFFNLCILEASLLEAKKIIRILLLRLKPFFHAPMLCIETIEA